jgi:hypothetical protein
MVLEFLSGRGSDERAGRVINRRPRAFGKRRRELTQVGGKRIVRQKEIVR